MVATGGGKYAVASPVPAMVASSGERAGCGAGANRTVASSSPELATGTAPNATPGAGLAPNVLAAGVGAALGGVVGGAADGRGATAPGAGRTCRSRARSTSIVRRPWNAAWPRAASTSDGWSRPRSIAARTRACSSGVMSSSITRPASLPSPRRATPQRTPLRALGSRQRVPPSIHGDRRGRAEAAQPRAQRWSSRSARSASARTAGSGPSAARLNHAAASSTSRSTPTPSRSMIPSAHMEA